jgi:hypothetical protein
MQPAQNPPQLKAVLFKYNLCGALIASSNSKVYYLKILENVA